MNSNSMAAADDTTTTTVAPEGVAVLLHPLLSEAEATEEGEGTETNIITDNEKSANANDQEGNNNNTLFVSLYRNFDFNAVIEYNKYNGSFVELRKANRNGVNVFLTRTRSSTSFAGLSSTHEETRLPFKVCYQSNHLLMFVKAHIDPCATFARLYTKDAWNIHETCHEKSLAQERMLILLGGIIGFAGYIIFMTNGMPDHATGSYCLKQIVGMVIGLLMLLLGILVLACRKCLAPKTTEYIYQQLGLKERCPAAQTVNDTTNQYLFELAQQQQQQQDAPHHPMMMPTTTNIIPQQDVVLVEIV